jgi:photosystem II stability/assembly factor-like uncharacterized protein
MSAIHGFVLLLPALLFTQPSLAAVSVQQVRGRCVGCERPYQLSHFQFVTPLEAWATAFQIVVSDGHVSQNSGVLHTSDAGKTWTPVAGVETYGVEVEPAFWFISARKGWIGWNTTSEPLDHLTRTANGGRRRIELTVTTPGVWAHLRFFDPRLGYAAISTLDGPQFGITRDSGETWRFRSEPRQAGLAYPEVMLFLNPRVGWIGGTTRHSDDIRPGLVRTVDGGDTWQEASFPPNVRGNPHDLFFLDADRGWLVLWNAPATAFLRTTDGGRTWSEDSTWISPQHGSDLYAVRYLSARVGVLLVGKTIAAEAYSIGAKGDSVVLATLDAGRTWSRHELPAPVQSCEVVADDVWCSSGMDILRIHVQP